MTTLDVHHLPPVRIEPAPVAPARSGRLSRWVAAACVVLLVGAFAGIFARRYSQVQEVLRTDRRALADARVSLARAEDALAATLGETDATERRTADTDRRTKERVDQRKLYAAAVELTRERIWNTGVALDQTQQALEQVIARAVEVATCLDGVQKATYASGSGNDSAAVAALQGARDTCRVALAAASGTTYPYDFPDPYVLLAGGTYYAYSTNSGAGDIQVLRSSDLADWQIVGNGLAGLPSWAAANSTWAPSALQRAGGFVVYYTVRDAASGRQCISRAFGTSPGGPFTDDSTGPLICRHDLGGSIDPSPFVDADGSAWLVWKNENHGPEPATIWSQRLADDGLSLVGDAAPLLRADRAWEGGVVEGPAMVRDGGVYYLFYSGSDWKTRRYAVGWAACSGPQGPCTKPPGGALVASGGTLAGPGGQELFRDGSGRWTMAFHAYTEPEVGYPSSRLLHFAHVRFVNGAPIVDART